MSIDFALFERLGTFIARKENHFFLVIEVMRLKVYYVLLIMCWLVVRRRMSVNNNENGWAGK
jgi:hypothetical protein